MAKYYFADCFNKNGEDFIVVVAKKYWDKHHHLNDKDPKRKMSKALNKVALGLEWYIPMESHIEAEPNMHEEFLNNLRQSPIWEENNSIY